MNAIETGKKVLGIEARAISRIAGRLDSSFSRAVELLLNNRGRLVVTGMGKSGLIGKKIAATLTSTGTPALFLHPSEAIHGDIGILQTGDVVLALSSSGETAEVLRLLTLIRRLGSPLIALVGSMASTLARESDVALDCSVEQEACPTGLVPTTSTTVALAMGDALAVALMEGRGFSEEDFRFNHPGGNIGKKLLKVRHLMHPAEVTPRVEPDCSLSRALDVMDAFRFGLVLVVDAGGRLCGIFTDGDLRRFLLKNRELDDTPIHEAMSSHPYRIGGERLAVEALAVMEEKHVTALAVVGESDQLEGLVHLHDLWRTEMI